MKNEKGKKEQKKENPEKSRATKEWKPRYKDNNRTPTQLCWVGPLFPARK